MCLSTWVIITINNMKIFGNFEAQVSTQGILQRMSLISSMVVGLLSCAEATRTPVDLSCQDYIESYNRCIGEVTGAEDLQETIQRCKKIRDLARLQCFSRDQGAMLGGLMNDGGVNADMVVQSDSSVDAGTPDLDMAVDAGGVDLGMAVDDAGQADSGMAVDAGGVDLGMAVDDSGQADSGMVVDAEIEPREVPEGFADDIDELTTIMQDNMDCLRDFPIYRGFVRRFFREFQAALVTSDIRLSNECERFEIIRTRINNGLVIDYAAVVENGCFVLDNFKYVSPHLMGPEYTELNPKYYFFEPLTHYTEGSHYLIRLSVFEDGFNFVEAYYEDGSVRSTANDCSEY